MPSSLGVHILAIKIEFKNIIIDENNDPISTKLVPPNTVWSESESHFTFGSFFILYPIPDDIFFNPIFFLLFIFSFVFSNNKKSDD